jgi:gluconolactonase
MNRFLHVLACATLFVTALGGAAAQPTGSPWFGGRPDATVDLTRPDGVAAINGQWRYAPARIVEIDSPSMGEDLKANGPLVKTFDVEPKAADKDFDDSQWQAIAPPAPRNRFGNGRFSLGWFRINVTVPEKVGSLETAGSNLVLEAVVDDYAEVWVDGKLSPEVFGQAGGAFINGWNAPNRLVIARNVQPGQKFQIAILAMNGPISSPPSNFIWFRSAALDFYAAEKRPANSVVAQVDRLDPSIDSIIASGTQIEKLAGGFSFTEGPYWTPGHDGDPGYLLFSDPNENTIYRLTDDGELFEFRVKSGYSGMDIGEYRQPGSNGLTRDRQGLLTICEHGNRRVTRIEKNGLITELADRFEGKRLNSPNDLVYRSDGALFFTDPPFGLPKFHSDSRRELAWSGVFCLKDGALNLISNDLSGPNGLAFSPDERFLYVGDWDDKHKTVTKYEVDAQGKVLSANLFCDLTQQPGEDAIDGIKVDSQGNVFISGPGGLWVYSSDGRALGVVHPPEHPHNLAFGGDDGRTLFMTCQTGVYKMPVQISGATLR